MKKEVLDFNKINHLLISTKNYSIFNYDGDLLKYYNQALSFNLEKEKIKRLELISEYPGLQQFTNLKKLIYNRDGSLAGYSYGNANDTFLENYIYSSKSKKIEILRDIREIIDLFNSEDIYFGNFDDVNSFSISNNGITLNNADDYKIGENDFLNKQDYVTTFERCFIDNKNVDVYGLNLFTIMFYQRYCDLLSAKTSLRNEGLPYRLNTTENKELVKKTLVLNNGYEREYFIDNVKKGLF